MSKNQIINSITT